MVSIKNQINDIMLKKQGEIFSINDFYSLGTKNTVKSILYRLCEDHKIVRLIDGLYTSPKYSKILKEYSFPSTSAVAEKLADKFCWNITPTGDSALNYTGLSTQVPNDYIYISDGPYREYIYRNKKIIFKHTSNRNISSYSKKLSITIQAIKALGEGNISNNDIQRLALFANDIPDELTNNTLKVPFWIREILLEIKENINE